MIGVGIGRVVVVMLFCGGVLRFLRPDGLRRIGSLAWGRVLRPIAAAVVMHVAVFMPVAVTMRMAVTVSMAVGRSMFMVVPMLMGAGRGGPWFLAGSGALVFA